MMSILPFPSLSGPGSPVSGCSDVVRQLEDNISRGECSIGAGQMRNACGNESCSAQTLWAWTWDPAGAGILRSLAMFELGFTARGVMVGLLLCSKTRDSAGRDGVGLGRRRAVKVSSGWALCKPAMSHFGWQFDL